MELQAPSVYEISNLRCMKFHTQRDGCQAGIASPAQPAGRLRRAAFCSGIGLCKARALPCMSSREVRLSLVTLTHQTIHPQSHPRTWAARAVLRWHARSSHDLPAKRAKIPCMQAANSLKTVIRYDGWCLS